MKSFKKKTIAMKWQLIALHLITLRKIILPTNWLRFFVYSTSLVCKMNNCIIPLTI